MVRQRGVTSWALMLVAWLTSVGAWTAPERPPTATLPVASDLEAEGIRLAADSVEFDTFRLSSSLRLERSRSSRSFLLRDSTWLRLNRATPPGPYPLVDEGTLVVHAPTKGWLHFTTYSKPTRLLRFRVDCDRLCGVIVRRDRGDLAEPDSSSWAHYFAAPRFWLGSGGTAFRPLPRHLFIAPSWYPRAHCAVPLEDSGRVRLDWITYDRPDPVFSMGEKERLPRRPPAILRAERRLSASGEGNPEIAELAGLPVERRLRVRWLGSAVVDLATGRVVRRTGSVHLP